VLLAIATISFSGERVTAQPITTSYVPVTVKAGPGVTVSPVTPPPGDKTFYNTIFTPIHQYASLAFNPTNGGNFSGASALLIDVKSNNDTAITLVIRIIDQNGALYAANAQLVPRQEKTIAFPFIHLEPRNYGMSTSPPVVNYVPSNFQQIDENFVTPPTTPWTGPSSVGSIQMLTYPSSDQPPINLTFGQPQIQMNGVISDIYKNLVDTYGQSTQSTWPEKVSSIADLQSKQNAETQQLRRWTAGRTDLDSFGGTKSIPLKNDTKFFQTLYSDGRWWLVTPEGHGFFQLGLDVIIPENGYTITDGRHRMFEDLSNLQATYPDQMIPQNAVAGQEYFNHYGANLERKYGSAIDPETKLPIYLEQFKQRATWRLEGWRFNTVGWESYNEFVLHPTFPFVYGLKLKHYFTGAVVPGYASNHLGNMFDPFDPTFDSAVNTMVQDIPSNLINQSYLIGYFVDNELPWGNGEALNYKDYYALSVNALALNFQKSPAKQAFINMLYQAYEGNIARLNASWGTSISSWEVLKDPFSELPATANAALTADLSMFLRRFADLYFGTVKKALKAYDPNHLYCGCRFSRRDRAAEVIASCASYADVVSFNHYGYHVSDFLKKEFKSATNKPVILSEFHFGSHDRGPAWAGLADAGSETNRGYWYSQYVSELASLPNVIGCDYYQYLDEPTSGERYDGANGHIGFVSIADVPFLDFAASVRQTNMKAAAIHATIPVTPTQ